MNLPGHKEPHGVLLPWQKDKMHLSKMWRLGMRHSLRSQQLPRVS